MCWYTSSKIINYVTYNLIVCWHFQHLKFNTWKYGFRFIKMTVNWVEKTRLCAWLILNNMKWRYYTVCCSFLSSVVEKFILSEIGPKNSPLYDIRIEHWHQWKIHTMCQYWLIFWNQIRHFFCMCVIIDLMCFFGFIFI